MIVEDNANSSIDDLEIQECLEEYADWIEMGWSLNRDEQDDVFPIISMREDIHLLVQAMDDDELKGVLPVLRDLDAKWQASLVRNRDPNFRYGFKNFNEPKEKWWWWIDRFDELTEEEKSTI